MEHKQSLLTLTKRLLKIAATLKKFFVISTIVSIIGNISQMGLMGFGAAFILSVAGKLKYANSVTYCILMIMSGILIVTCRYLAKIAHSGSVDNGSPDNILSFF